jgi:hypothetical protein
MEDRYQQMVKERVELYNTQLDKITQENKHAQLLRISQQIDEDLHMIGDENYSQLKKRIINIEKTKPNTAKTNLSFNIKPSPPNIKKLKNIYKEIEPDYLINTSENTWIKVLTTLNRNTEKDRIIWSCQANELHYIATKIKGIFPRFPVQPFCEFCDKPNAGNSPLKNRDKKTEIDLIFEKI